MIEITLDIVKFLNTMDLAEKTIEHMAEKVFKESCEIIMDNTIRWTPVGKPELWKYPNTNPFYEPGTLKGSWRLNFPTPREATLINNVVYAQRVEDGWSTQAPYGMLKRAIALWPSIVETAANKVNRSESGNTELFGKGGTNIMDPNFVDSGLFENF